MKTLDQLKIGERGIIAAMVGPDAVVQRLMEMGLTEGEEVELVRRAPLGDPIEIRIRDYDLSLRASEASRVSIAAASD